MSLRSERKENEESSSAFVEEVVGVKKKRVKKVEQRHWAPKEISRVEMIQIDLPVVDPKPDTPHAYQRKLDPKRVEQMAKEFNPKLFRADLSLRTDGTYAIVDGQHCLAAACLAGFGSAKLPMKIHRGLTLENESLLFNKLNSTPKRPDSFTCFISLRNGGDPKACEIDRIVRQQKCRITRSTTAVGSVRAVESLWYAYRRGPKNLAFTIRVLYEWMDGKPAAFDNGLIRGISAFYEAFPNVDPDRLVKRLQSFPNHVPVLNQIKSTAKSCYWPRSRAAVEVFARIYNYRLSPKERLIPVE